MLMRKLWQCVPVECNHSRLPPFTPAVHVLRRILKGRVRSYLGVVGFIGFKDSKASMEGVGVVEASGPQRGRCL